MKVTVDIEAQDSSQGELYICTNSVWKDAILMLTDMTCLEPGVVKATVLHAKKGVNAGQIVNIHMRDLRPFRGKLTFEC